MLYAPLLVGEGVQARVAGGGEEFYRPTTRPRHQEYVVVRGDELPPSEAGLDL